jgi:hypothetical protein
MNKKLCVKCKQEKPVSEFYRSASSKDGYRPYCKDCARQYIRDYTKTGYFNDYQKRPEVKARIRANKSLYRQREDVKVKNTAREYTNHKIRAGAITREPCAFCGKEQTEAHHPDYSKPLSIVWLCSDCHRELHLKSKYLKE